MDDGYHLSLGLGRALWEDLLRAALPVGIVAGEFDLAENARGLVRRLEVRQRITGLLEDKRTPALVVRAKNRASKMWHQRREIVYQRVSDLIRVEGEWRVELDDLGTNLRYGRQRVSADAYLKGVAEGTLYLLRENIEIPFVIEKRIGASVTLGDIHYDPEHRAVIGSFRDLALHVGDRAVMQLIARLAELALEKQLTESVNPLTILRRDLVEEMVGGIGGPLKLKMGVEHLDLEITNMEMTLRVRFGFSQLQLEDHAMADDGY